MPELPFDFSIMPMMAQVAKYIFYFAVSGCILAGGWFLLYITQYNMKIKYWVLHGSGKDGHFQIGDMKTNRARLNPTKTAWRMLWPLGNKEDVQPFDPEYIYPGNVAYAFKLGKFYMPGRLNANVIAAGEEDEEEIADYRSALSVLNRTYNVNQDGWFPIKIGGALQESSIRGSMDPMPTHWDKWLQAEIHQNAAEYSVENFWDQNKQFFMTMGTILLCVVMVGLCVYFIYKMLTEGRPEAAALTSALNNFANTLGAGSVSPG